MEISCNPQTSTKMNSGILKIPFGGEQHTRVYSAVNESCIHGDCRRFSQVIVKNDDLLSKMNSEVTVKPIVLRDLQSLLQETLGQDLIVKSYDTNSLLPPGENYGSTILKVHAIVKKNAQAPEEELNLVAKMPPPTEFQKMIFDSPFTFRKEIFMYKDILPAYNELEKEVGLKDVFDILPRYFGSRMSLYGNVEFDDDAVILLENLKTRGYYTGDRNMGYDFEHSKFAIRAMARFHALGIAMKYKKPEIFEVFKAQSKCMDFKSENFIEVHMLISRKINEDPIMKPYHDRCRKLLIDEDYSAGWLAAPEEPWSTIIHSDFWVNNIMFHRGNDGKVDDVKFIDFQNYLFFSPLRQLIFYLFSSMDESIREEGISELISYYHTCLLEVLTKLGCNTEPFAKEKFDAQLPLDANFEFVHLCIMLRVLTLDTKETDLCYNKLESIMVDYQGSQLYIDRLRKVVLYFSKHNWI